jgi:type IV pilus modification protein PilV
MRRAGYTLIEVMTAMVVMTIGVAGILAMQGATARANQDAYESGVAANFANSWLERLKRDARRWTSTGNVTLANTNYLSGPLNTRDQPDTFFVPAAVRAGTDLVESPAADYFGFEVEPAQAYYCVNLSLVASHAYNPASPAAWVLPRDVNAIQAAVRVWWYRWGPDADRAAATGCLPDQQLTAVQNRDPLIRKQYYATIISWREPGWP